MQTAQIKKTIISEYKNGTFGKWVGVRIVSSFTPLVVTYVFALGVKVIEDGNPPAQAIKVFALLVVIEMVDHVLRLSSKTRIEAYSEAYLINIQTRLIEDISPTEENKREVTQSIRNLTQPLRRFVDHMNNNGVTAIVSFIAIPVILFFIDVRVFLLQIVLMLIYTIVTIVFSFPYEKNYEAFDQARENYYSELLAEGKVKKLAELVRAKFMKVQNLRFFEWFTLQNVVSIFNFIIIVLVLKDIYAGTKQISDLVLIVGYTAGTKAFLNELTTTVTYNMQVKAGIQRIVAVTEGLVDRVW